MPVATRRQPTVIQSAILNRCARELGAFLCTRPLEEIRGWAEQEQDLVAQLPRDFTVPLNGFAKHLVLPALRTMGEECWDKLLHLLDGMAESVRAMDPSQDPVATHLQHCVALCADMRHRRWYHRQMESLRDLIVSKLEGAS